MSLDLAGDVADIVRRETLTTDNGTLVDGHRVADLNMVRDRRTNMSQFYGEKLSDKEWSWKILLRVRPASLHMYI